MEIFLSQCLLDQERTSEQILTVPTQTGEVVGGFKDKSANKLDIVRITKS